MKNEKVKCPKSIRSGRPRKDAKKLRDVRITISFTYAEAEHLKQYAKKRGYKQVAPMLHRLIWSLSKQPEITLDPSDMHMLANLANNTNQIAKHLNSGGDYRQEWCERSTATAEIVGRLYQAINKLRSGKIVVSQ
jgi:hypothetical protein